MKRMQKVAVALGLILTGLVPGIIIGFWNGQEAMWIIDAPAKGGLATTELKAFDAGNSEPSRYYLEMDIDQGLYFHSISKEKWWYPLYTHRLLLGTSPDRQEEIIKMLAKYRMINPSHQLDEKAFEKAPSNDPEQAKFYKEMNDANKDRIRRIDQIIKEYGRK